MRRLVLCALVVGLLIGADPLAASANDPPIAQGTGDITRSVDELWADVGKIVPEFGGFFYSQEQRALKIYVTAQRPGIAEDLRAALESVFKSNLDGQSLDNIVLLEGRYGMLQLIEWRDRMRRGSMMSVRCVTSIGFAEPENRLRVRVEGLGAKPLVESKLDELGIPREAVIIKQGVVQLLGGTSPHQSPDPRCAAPNKMGVVWWVGGAGALILAAGVARLLFARRSAKPVLA